MFFFFGPATDVAVYLCYIWLYRVFYTALHRDIVLIHYIYMSWHIYHFMIPVRVKLILLKYQLQP